MRRELSPKKQKSQRTLKKSVTDQKKEQILKALCGLMERCGVVVRRERLKRGIHWNVHSGVCSLRSQPVVFVDRALEYDEQTEVLVQAIQILGLRERFEPGEVESLPPPLQKLIKGEELSEAA